jgi:hypothetical protein
MRKIHRVVLALGLRETLEKIVGSDSGSSLKSMRTRALLLADESPEGEALKDPEIRDAIGIKPATLSRLRLRCGEVGALQAVERRRRSSPARAPLLDGDLEGRLVDIAHSEPPPGSSRWTIRLLAKRLLEQKHVESISPETVRRALLRRNISLL